MKRALLAAAALLALAGCGNGAGTTRVDVDTFDRPGGGDVECASTSRGGIDCNWDDQ